MLFAFRKDPWPAVVERASASVVMLFVDLVRSWDGMSPCSRLGSGFVVDKRLGIILTSRKVLTDGPVTGKAMFLDNEETKIYPLYVDPEHDFAFVRFDPKSISYMQVQELKLYPEGARMGVEIRVVGSDAGEKLMVLDGTISDCMRMPPDYDEEEGGGSYRDVNIFYMTSSSSTSGGSDGAPVLDSRGRVVAMNTGGMEDAASSFFLPLERVVRALKMLQKNLYGPIPRGTIQTVFVFTHMDQLRRLGLPNEFSLTAKAGSTKSFGGLVVARANIGGTGLLAGLRTGDILFKVNDNIVTNFLDLEKALDEAVENSTFKVKLEVFRNSEKVELEVAVQDMTPTVMPQDFIEFSEGVIQPLSYQLAFMAQVPVGSVYVSFPGYALGRMGITTDCVIEEIGDTKINCLDDFERAICSYHDGERVQVRYFNLRRKHFKALGVLCVDRKWFRMRRATNMMRSGEVDHWVFRNCPLPEKAAPDRRRPSLIQARRVSFKHLENVTVQSPQANSVLQSIVWIEFSSPFVIDGLNDARGSGCGVVVDAELGLVWVDRGTVSSLLGDVTMVVASSFEIECKVVFLHPIYGFAFVQYDPTLLGGTELKSLPLFDSTGGTGEPDLKRGDVLTFAGFTNQMHYQVATGCTVRSIERSSVVIVNGPPCFTPKSFERIDFDVKTNANGGVYIDGSGRARAFFSTGTVSLTTHSTPVSIALKRVQSALDMNMPIIPPIGSLGIDFDLVTLSEARSDYGLPEEWAKRISEACDADVSGVAQGARKVTKVINVRVGTPVADMIKAGDLFLSVDGETVVSYSQIDLIAMRACDQRREVKCVICRDKSILELTFFPVPLLCNGTQRLACFSGVLVQPTHAPVFYYGFAPDFACPDLNPGVYITSIARGSPAESAGVNPVTFLLEINSEPVRTLDDVVRIVRNVPHGESMVLTMVGLDAQVSVATLEVDLHYWPTQDLKYDSIKREWNLTEIESELKPEKS